MWGNGGHVEVGALRIIWPHFFRAIWHIDVQLNHNLIDHEAEVGVDFHQVEDGALIDSRFNGQRQAEPAEVTGRAQGMRVGFRRDRGLLLWRNPHLYRCGLFASFSFFGVH